MREIAEMTRAHRQEGQGVRPRHDARRLRDAGDAVPELRRRGEGELPPLRLHRQAGRARRLRLLHRQDPGRPHLRARRGRGASCATRRSARSRASARRPAGRSPPSSCSCATTRRQLEARVRLRRRRQAAKAKRASRSTSASRRASAPARSAGRVYEFGTNYVCEHAVGANVTCDFKSGKIILQQPVAREQMSKLLADRQDRPARQLRLEQDAAQVQGLPGLGREGRQGRASSSSRARRRRRRRRRRKPRRRRRSAPTRKSRPR